MPLHQLTDGTELQVGDIIVARNAFGVQKYTVHRVTPKFAFVRWNAVAEGRFPRTFSYKFGTLPRQKWSLTHYEVFRKEP